MSLLKSEIKSRRADSDSLAAASFRTDDSNLTESAVRPYTELPAQRTADTLDQSQAPTHPAIY